MPTPIRRLKLFTVIIPLFVVAACGQDPTSPDVVFPLVVDSPPLLTESCVYESGGLICPETGIDKSYCILLNGVWFCPNEPPPTGGDGKE